MSIIEKAARIAAYAHRKQVRKSDGSPYIVHLFIVALKLMKYDFSDRTIAAALLHDVLEDTDVTAEHLRAELDDEVTEVVLTLSEDKILPWEKRKQAYIEAVRRGAPEVKAISIADKIHNLESLLIAHAEQGPSIWEKFNQGKEKKLWFEEELLKMFKETWQHPLVEEYGHLVIEMRKLT